MAALVKNGMISSLSTDILQKDVSVVSGLQKDIEKIFNMVLKDENGNSTGVEKNINIAIDAFAMAGFSADQIMSFGAESMRHATFLGEIGERITEAMSESSERLKTKREGKEVSQILSEAIMSPDSEAMRFGSYMLMASDIAARYTLYTHLMNNRKTIDPSNKDNFGKNKKRKMTEEEIVIKVLEAFVDYKVNMPKELKALSDYGVLLFPSYWLRVQKIIYAMAKDNPLKIVPALMLEDILNMHVASIADSNVFTKFANGIITEPPVFTDPLDMIIPTDFVDTIWG